MLHEGVDDGRVGVGMGAMEREGMRGKINTLSWTIAAHVSQSTRPLRHKFRGFNKDSWLPLAERTTAVYGSGSSERRASGRRLLRRSLPPIGVEFSYEIYAKVAPSSVPRGPGVT